ncbi:hypothetical protein P691DRAFT_689435 [Macrolepiota fuliginosa MF-IS2]|uniref:Uncharacterized protein n=1 Tax=Macrolepiota fuliginosa MF-IS2 TaxID=1400762 RepID=A0A9P6BUF7_9AGAR|nr:hypothetical protein P691DRAFT_689435 [Macrolepiota fuliginosa MF-IS2]
MLWDSGSTTTSIMPMLAQIANVEVSELIDLHTLQLGTIRSRSQVKYGTTMDLRIKGCKYTTYLDVANFDHYDMIIGTLFMHKHSVFFFFFYRRLLPCTLRTAKGCTEAVPAR